MIDVKILIGAVVGLISIGSTIVGFFVMQNTQNMKIKALEDRVLKIENRVSKNIHYQMETEKAIVEIKTILSHISEAIEELKRGKNDITN